MSETGDVQSRKDDLYNQTTEKVYAKKVECDLGCAGKYNMETVPPTMAKDEYRYCREDRLIFGEKEAIEALGPNILQKINAVEELHIHGNRSCNAFFTLTTDFFNAFTDYRVSLKELRNLTVSSCILKLTINEVNSILTDCKLIKFEYSQNRNPEENYYGTPVNFLSDQLLQTITESIVIGADCASICLSVTDQTLKAWEKSLPSKICLERCHTSFTIKAIWELVQVARKKDISVRWNFGYIDSNENNLNTLVELQKISGFYWTKWQNRTYTIKYAANLSKNMGNFIMFRVVRRP